MGREQLREGHLDAAPGRTSACFVAVMLFFLACAGVSRGQDPGASNAATVDDYSGYTDAELQVLQQLSAGLSAEVLARQALTGTWQVVILEQDGLPNRELAKDLQMKFYRGRLELMQKGRPTRVVSYHIDLAPEPPRFDWKIPQTLARQKGIYWLEGDILKICIGPVYDWGATQFLTQPGDGRTLFVMKRIATTNGT